MAKNTSITLGDHFDEFISDRIKNGRYGSASEVVRAGLRLLETTETKLEMLRAMLAEGENSGFADYSYDNLIKELDNESH
ncbi:MAG: type II toxin-antitoxin system ParD family antitoxin [Gammaproteobacteria bacterium]|nr:type II toxin-antitoxin system ParD family antitoxin [Gammaproteobacteria bacterium]